MKKVLNNLRYKEGHIEFNGWRKSVVEEIYKPWISKEELHKLLMHPDHPCYESAKELLNESSKKI